MEDSIKVEYELREETRRNNTVTILIGTFLEFFDLMLYIHMGIILQEYFFGPTDIYQDKIWGAFAGWCLSYVGRPFGSSFFGYLGDNFGRKNIFIFTAILMALSSFTMALLPGYATKGSQATIMFIICRLLQSISAGGEFPGAITYLSEINRDKDNECFVLALTRTFVEMGCLCALVVAYICLSSELEWAWRMPFIFGSIVALIGGFARSTLKESPLHIKSKPKNKSIFFKSLKENLKNENFFYLLLMLSFPFESFFVYAMGAKKLEGFGLFSFEIIQYNLSLAILMVLISLSMAYLTYRFDPIKMVKVKAFIALLALPIIFYGYTLFSSAHEFIILQLILVLFLPSDVPLIYLYARIFDTSCCYTAFGTTWVSARIISNIVGAFLHTFLYQHCGYWGNFLLFFLGSLIYFFCADKFRKFESKGNLSLEE